MGVVYACKDTLTREVVAVKLLHTVDGTPAPGTAAWFWAEARALASLDHPGIVRGRDFGVLLNTAPYLVMDLAPGRSLPDVLVDTELQWPAIWLITDQVLAALGHAHARGIIHGDLKHSNIMVELLPGDLRIRLLDFGLAWLLRDRFDHRIDGTAREGPMVRPHAGTVGWMAPEQIRGAVPHVGPPTDLYALGCILFQLLTGTEPYEHPDLQEVQKMHRNAPVPDLDLPPGVPAGVAPFVQRLLQKRPWHRYPYAADARAVFAQFRPKGDQSTWRLPESSASDDIPTLRPPPMPSNEAPRFVIPRTDATAPGLLGFGPARFVGRTEAQRELRLVCDRMLEAPSGSFDLLLLTGEPGVGKSRLAEWLCEDAHERGVAIPLRARHNRIPTPVDGIIGAVLSHFGLENADRAVTERALVNVWDIPKDDEESHQWVAAVGELLRPATHGRGDEDTDAERRFVINNDEIRYAVIRHVLTRVGQDRPLLIWLDDLHHAAPRDFTWIEKLLTDRPALRVVLLATMAAHGPEPSIDSMARVTRLVDRFGGRTMEIAPLSEQEMSELLLTSAALDDLVVRTAWQRSNGNPLFALQLVHAWANGGWLESREGRYYVKPEALGAMPATTAAVWDERLAALPEEARRAAMVASALGGDVRSDVLVPLLTNLGIPAFSTLTMLEQLQLLGKVDATRYRWPHMLLQEHLLSKLGEQPDAANVFRQAALALASYHPAAGNRRVVRHRVTNLLRAGDEAEAVHVMLDFVARAWERTRDVGATLEDLAMIDGLARGRWAAMHNRWRAEALRHAGQLDEATSLAFAARRAFHNLNDVLNEAQCLRLLGHIASEKGTPRDGRKLVAEAYAVMDAQGQEWGRAQCEVVLGELDYLLADHNLAQQELTHALGPLERARDVLRGGQCLILLALIAIARNDPNAARAYLTDARRGFDRIGYRLGTAQCDVALAHADHRCGELEAAKARSNNALAAFRMLRTPRGQTAACRVMAMAEIDGGELAEAEQHARECLELFETMGDPWGLVESKLLIAQVALARGAPEAEALIEEIDVTGVQEREPLQHWRLTRAWLACRKGAFQDAVAELELATEAMPGGSLADHGLQLYARLVTMPWPEELRERVFAALPSTIASQIGSPLTEHRAS